MIRLSCLTVAYIDIFDNHVPLKTALGNRPIFISVYDSSSIIDKISESVSNI